MDKFFFSYNFDIPLDDVDKEAYEQVYRSLSVMAPIQNALSQSCIAYDHVKREMCLLSTPRKTVLNDPQQAMSLFMTTFPIKQEMLPGLQKKCHLQRDLVSSFSLVDKKNTCLLLMSEVEKTENWSFTNLLIKRVPLLLSRHGETAIEILVFSSINKEALENDFNVVFLPLKRLLFLYDNAEEDWKTYEMKRYSLTDRRIVMLCSYGLSSERVAKELNMSRHTVNDHLKRLRKRFRVKTMTGLISVMRNLQLI